MKRTLITIAGMALAGTAMALVDPRLPMVTGRGNVTGGPGKVIVTNQTDTSSDQTVKLNEFLVTGSLIHKPGKTVKGR
jgi:hypothetical protein